MAASYCDSCHLSEFAAGRQLNPRPDWALGRWRLYSFSPVGVTAFLQTNGQGTIRIGWLVTGPAHRAPYSLGLQFRPQADLLAIHALGKNDGSLPNLPGQRLARVEIASHSNSPIEAFGVNAQDAGH